MPGRPVIPTPDPSQPIRAVILGNDAVLAAQPAEPIQLVRACSRAGFDFVAPVSWGDELLSERIADVLNARHPSAAVVANCPFVAESLRSTPTRTRAIAGVSPPVATARYLRAAFDRREVHVTYIGACPGATSPDIDERLLPDVFLAALVRIGIDVHLQPCHLEGQLPADRSRFASLPGGAPEPQWLAGRTGVTGLEVTPATVDAVAALHPRTPVLLDLGAACGCACARDRANSERIDPPRSPAPVVLPVTVALADHRLLPPHRLLDAEDIAARAPLAERMRELRATFLEHGLSEVDALRPPEPLTSHRLSAALEPWTPVNGTTTDRPIERLVVDDSLAGLAPGDATRHDDRTVASERASRPR